MNARSWLATCNWSRDQYFCGAVALAKLPRGIGNGVGFVTGTPMSLPAHGSGRHPSAKGQPILIQAHSALWGSPPARPALAVQGLPLPHLAPAAMGRGERDLAAPGGRGPGPQGRTSGPAPEPPRSRRGRLVRGPGIPRARGMTTDDDPIYGLANGREAIVSRATGQWRVRSIFHLLDRQENRERVAGPDARNAPPHQHSQGLAQADLVLPPPAVAQAFEAAVAPIMQRLLNNLHQARAVSALRDALLLQLISGELRTGAVTREAPDLSPSQDRE